MRLLNEPLCQEGRFIALIHSFFFIFKKWLLSLIYKIKNRFLLILQQYTVTALIIVQSYSSPLSTCQSKSDVGSEMTCQSFFYPALHLSIKFNVGPEFYPPTCQSCISSLLRYASSSNVIDANNKTCTWHIKLPKISIILVIVNEMIEENDICWSMCHLVSHLLIVLDYLGHAYISDRNPPWRCFWDAWY